MSTAPPPAPSAPDSTRKRKGRKPAIVGVLALAVALATSRIVGGVSGGADEDPDQRMSGAGDRSAVSLAVGDCFTGSRRAGVHSAVPVPCSRPHDGEVFATVALSGTAGADGVLAQQSYHQCGDRLTDYVLDDWSLPHTTGVNYYYPTRAVRQSGDRTVTCFTADTDGRTTGSVRVREADLTSHQFLFLRLELASGRVFRAYPRRGGVDACRVWAAKTAAALDHEADDLEDATWSAGARSRVTAYVGELRKGAELWREAVEARSDQGYWNRSDDAWNHPSATYQRDVRKALRLASDLPATSFGPPF